MPSRPRGAIFVSAALWSLLVAGHCVAQITGTVTNANGGGPIPGAMVTWQAQGVRATADELGAFVISVPTTAGVKIVGAAKGFFNTAVVVDAPATGVVITLSPVPQDDDPTYELADPTMCAFCHPNQYAEWLDSPMNNAGVNTWVDDLYSGLGTPGGMGGFVYARDSIFAPTNPNSECASCHQPETWIQTPFAPLDDPTLPRTPGALHGVSCDVCHKIANVDESKINFPGIFPGAVTFTRPAGPAFHPVQYGVLGDVDYDHPAWMRASYQPQLVAEVCAACHQDASDPEENHTYTGPISEPTYLEWIDSPYGDPQSPLYATCVDCHMPPAEYSTVCEILVPPLEREYGSIRSHRIEGTTPFYLENAAELSITANRVGPLIHVQANITNSQTGHHLPTGVTVRNVILRLEAWRTSDQRKLHYASEQVIHALGGVGDPAQGYFAGLPGKLFAKLIEDFDGNAPTFFTDAAAIVFDNRIPALATDASTYDFVVPGGGGDVVIRAELIYRRSFRTLVDAKQWTEDGHGNPLGDVQPPHYGHLMEQAESNLATVAGDFDGDDDSDLSDYVPFPPCLSGPDVPPSDAGCLAFDADNDNHIDIADFLAFQVTFGAP